MASQSFAAVWNWISSKLPTFKNPVVEISSSINLDATIHNGRLLVCSQPVTLTPLAANMGSGFHCHILNASSGNVTLGSGFVTSTGATSLTSWQSASVFCATYSGGTVVFASIAGAGSTTVPGVPGQVTSLAASGTTQTTISLVWQPPASGAVPASYTIQYRVSGTSTWVTASGITGTAYQISGLQAATGYDITIQAIAAGGNGSASTVLTVVTAASTSLPALPTVTNLSATAASSSSVTLTWIAGGGAASSYTVQYRTTGTTTWTTISGVTGTTSLISGLTAATGYDFGVFGVNSAGNGQLS
ncbi:MAG: fibronectin type III domain-containing protein, partial [Rhodospirillales bacterium]|nr:fibronectin type III domain-containing protein [Acetobacter sp.]